MDNSSLVVTLSIPVTLPVSRLPNAYFYFCLSHPCLMLYSHQFPFFAFKHSIWFHFSLILPRQVPHLPQMPSPSWSFSNVPSQELVVFLFVSFYKLITLNCNVWCSRSVSILRARTIFTNPFIFNTWHFLKYSINEYWITSSFCLVLYLITYISTSFTRLWALWGRDTRKTDTFT